MSVCDFFAVNVGNALTEFTLYGGNQYSVIQRFANHKWYETFVTHPFLVLENPGEKSKNPSQKYFFRSFILDFHSSIVATHESDVFPLLVNVLR